MARTPNPESAIRTGVRDGTDAPADGRRYGGGVKLADWLDEYRQLDPSSVTRAVADRDDDWADEDLMAPADRVRDTRPRWMSRARDTGYGRPGRG